MWEQWWVVEAADLSIVSPPVCPSFLRRSFDSPPHRYEPLPVFLYQGFNVVCRARRMWRQSAQQFWGREPQVIVLHLNLVCLPQPWVFPTEVKNPTLMLITFVTICSSCPTLGLTISNSFQYFLSKVSILLEREERVWQLGWLNLGVSSLRSLIYCTGCLCLGFNCCRNPLPQLSHSRTLFSLLGTPPRYLLSKISMLSER